ncbi:SDR family NAD(P)-dependent oxidoreductase [Stappia sp. ES.058]|uniref:SDR family NAD(P)-dependent oxidoreductase n=1 Tax=Stappia sp. ES.058 TaxID=1881061 RepID=UPI00087C45B9|nr:SDR family NAD(P)-dependent oxidoreductase [Stappia sp. ES.058]SDU03972.1 3-oxoacyl-[acyl-carrier protein] reductase [Stappia sp. ES.058]
MQLSFAGKRALVTGAAQGIGRAIALGLQQAGAALTLVDIDEAGLAASATGLEAECFGVDLGDRSAVHAMVDRLARDGKAPDILIHAAGGTRGQAGRPLEEIDEASWHAIFRANVDAAFWLAQACAPHMREKGAGRIVAIASGAGLRPSLTGIQAYTAAKHALVGIVRQLSLELGPQGITVNSVAPGFVRSNPTTERQWDAMGADGQARLVQSIHTRRLGTAEDIAAATLFLASDQASWITGQILSVDGGRS